MHTDQKGFAVSASSSCVQLWISLSNRNLQTILVGLFCQDHAGVPATVECCGGVEEAFPLCCALNATDQLATAGKSRTIYELSLRQDKWNNMGHEMHGSHGLGMPLKLTLNASVDMQPAWRFSAHGSIANNATHMLSAMSRARL